MSPLLNVWDVTETWLNWLSQVEQKSERLYKFEPDLVNIPVGLLLNDSLYNAYSSATVVLSDSIDDWSHRPPRNSAVFNQRQAQFSARLGNYDLPGADN